MTHTLLPGFPTTPVQMAQRIANDVADATAAAGAAKAEAQVVADAEPLAEVNKAIAEQLKAEAAEDAEPVEVTSPNKTAPKPTSGRSRP